MSLLFAAGAAGFATNKCYCRQPRCLIQPAGEDNLPAKLPGFSGENDEDGLRDFLGLMWVASVTQCNRIDLVDVPRDEFGKGFLGIMLRVLPQQSDVVQLLHLYLNAANAGKVTNYFQPGETPALPFKPAAL